MLPGKGTLLFACMWPSHADLNQEVAASSSPSHWEGLWVYRFYSDQVAHGLHLERMQKDNEQWPFYFSFLKSCIIIHTTEYAWTMSETARTLKHIWGFLDLVGRNTRFLNKLVSWCKVKYYCVSNIFMLKTAYHLSKLQIYRSPVLQLARLP